jgi:hypothetical protein
MSDEDNESMYDDEELSSMYEDGNPDALTPEDIFNMVMIDKVKGVKLKTVLIDKEGDPVDLTDIIEQLLTYMKDKLEEGNNQFADHVLPLMGQAMASTLSRVLGIAPTGFFLATPKFRDAFLYSMAMGFLLLKFVQQKGITITSTEEAVSEEEIEAQERKGHANSAAMLASMIGEDPVEVLKKMREEGRITEEDLKDLMGEDDGDKS